MPVPVRPHRSLIKPFVTVCLLVLIAGLGARAYVNRQIRRIPPAGYLIALDASSKASAGWGSRTVATVLNVLPGQTIKIPTGAHFELLHSDGRVEQVTGPTRILLPAPPPPDETDFMRSRFSEVLAYAKANLPAIPEKIRVMSPVGVTRFLNPIITWQARAGVNYDVAVRDPSDDLIPVRLARGVRPPIELAQLETPQNRRLVPDRIYEVVVRESVSETVIGGAHVLTRADATMDTFPVSPQDLLIEASSAMAKKPTRTGDAWLALSRLPNAWRQTELALRLRLQVAHELGYLDEIRQIEAFAKLK